MHDNAWQFQHHHILVYKYAYTVLCKDKWMDPQKLIEFSAFLCVFIFLGIWKCHLSRILSQSWIAPHAFEHTIQRKSDYNRFHKACSSISAVNCFHKNARNGLFETFANVTTSFNMPVRKQMRLIWNKTDLWRGQRKEIPRGVCINSISMRREKKGCGSRGSASLNKNAALI